MAKAVATDAGSEANTLPVGNMSAAVTNSGRSVGASFGGLVKYGDAGGGGFLQRFVPALRDIKTPAVVANAASKRTLVPNYNMSVSGRCPRPPQVAPTSWVRVGRARSMRTRSTRRGS